MVRTLALEKTDKFFEDRNMSIDRFIVAKKNDLINASYNLRTQEFRIVALIASMIHPDDKEFKVYSLKIKDIASVIEVAEDSLYSEIKKISDRLIKSVVTFKTDEKGGFFKISLVSSAKYLPNKGVLELSFHPEMKPYFIELKEHFTSYRLKNILHLKSLYSFRMYELLKQYLSLSKKGETEIVLSVKQIRWQFQIENSMSRWSDFKKSVLDKTMEEISSNTDIEFSWQPLKTGREITDIKFEIKKKNKDVPKNIDDSNDILLTIPEKYRNLKTVQDAVANSVEKNGIEYVRRNISYANKHSKKNYRAFLLKALKEDWSLQEEEEKRIQEEAQKVANEKIMEEFRKYDQNTLKALMAAGNQYAKKILEEC
ncbi:MAG: replication initiation protein [Desulforegulaceae bacterium]|nr:replication initiation protein [Desulforegulaceae bacterium]